MSSTSSSDAALTCSRRHFLGGGLSCGAYVALLLGGAAVLPRRVFASPATAAETEHSRAFARVERIADGVWAIISTPRIGEGGLRNGQTLCNGGLVAGRDGVVAIEGFHTPQGAAWVSDLALALTGRRPTHVVTTHYHFDHSCGLAGYQRGAQGPAIFATAQTRDLLRDRLGANPVPAGDEVLVAAEHRVLLPDRVVVELTDEGAGGIDLGDRRLWFRPRRGHTPSDLVIELEDPRVVWTGDLCFNGLFPYCGDAMPTQLVPIAHALLSDPDTVYVPGHGALGGAEDLRPYLDLLDDVDRAARAAHAAGTPPAVAAAEYRVPERLGEWILFSPTIIQMAFEAWERDLSGGAS